LVIWTGTTGHHRIDIPNKLHILSLRHVHHALLLSIILSRAFVRMLPSVLSLRFVCCLFCVCSSRGQRSGCGREDTERVVRGPGTCCRISMDAQQPKEKTKPCHAGSARLPTSLPIFQGTPHVRNSDNSQFSPKGFLGSPSRLFSSLIRPVSHFSSCFSTKLHLIREGLHSFIRFVPTLPFL